MVCYLITERCEDADFLEPILEAELKKGIGQGQFAVARESLRTEGEVRLMDGGTRSGAVSLARTIRTKRNEPVALIVNAESTSPEGREQLKRSLKAEMRLGSGSAPYEVFAAQSELQASIFQNDQVAKELFGEIPETTLVEARYRPRFYINQFLSEQKIAKPLPDLIAEHKNVLAALREDPLIREIRNFIEQSSRVAASSP